VLDRAGRCDVLVHAAAAFDRSDLARLDLAVWRRVQAVRSRQALPRTLQPDDVAATVTFLASDGAAALTGQVLCTDGGLVMR
jgi:NAD(P)-dependent dehydrogenase (short-subunit alcohol dehydrogenase family)